MIAWAAAAVVAAATEEICRDVTMRTAFIANEQREDILHTHTREQSQTILIFLFVLHLSWAHSPAKLGKWEKQILAHDEMRKTPCIAFSFSLSHIQTHTLYEWRRINLLEFAIFSAHWLMGWVWSDSSNGTYFPSQNIENQRRFLILSALIITQFFLSDEFFYRRMQSVEIMKVGNGSSRNVVR